MEIVILLASNRINNVSKSARDQNHDLDVLANGPLIHPPFQASLSRRQIWFIAIFLKCFLSRDLWFDSLNSKEGF